MDSAPQGSSSREPGRGQTPGCKDKALVLLEFSGIIRLFPLTSGWPPICQFAPPSEPVTLLEFSGIIRLFPLASGWPPICHFAPPSEPVTLLSKANHLFRNVREAQAISCPKVVDL